MCAVQSSSAFAQDPSAIIGSVIGIIGSEIERQQQIEAWKNSPEYQDQQIEPGGLTRGQVRIVQQLLLQNGHDIGAPDGIVGPKTMAVVAQMQRRAGVAVNGYPTQQLLDALLDAQ